MGLELFSSFAILAVETGRTGLAPDLAFLTIRAFRRSHHAQPLLLAHELLALARSDALRLEGHTAGDLAPAVDGPATVTARTESAVERRPDGAWFPGYLENMIARRLGRARP
jgi:hypothetical protein